MKKIIILVLISSASTFARITDGKTNYKIEKNKIELTIEKGFHINEKAPMTFKFYVCDDKNTACEEHEIKPKISK